MNQRIRHKCASVLLLLCLTAVTGCSSGISSHGGRLSEGQLPIEQQSAGSDTTDAQSAPGAVPSPNAQEAEVRLLAIGSTMYVPLRELIGVLELQTDWDATSQSLKLGDNDVSYGITINSTQAVKSGDPLTLPLAPVLQGEAAYLPVSAMADLLHEEMSYEVRKDRLIVHSSNVKVHGLDQAEAEGNGDGLDFGEDPTDPFRGTETGTTQEDVLPSEASLVSGDLPAAAGLEPEPEPGVVAAAAKNIDINALIRKGKQYLGVKYVFDAGPYPKTGSFDCSAYTQYVFGKYGVSLPRLARQQANRGNVISRKSLRRGDLLFFYVPGRFKSNRTVGHVGIYIGGNRMLHASPVPKDGVQITYINKAYWKDTFLFAKRVAY